MTQKQKLRSKTLCKKLAAWEIRPGLLWSACVEGASERRRLGRSPGSLGNRLVMCYKHTALPFEAVPYGGRSEARRVV